MAAIGGAVGLGAPLHWFSGFSRPDWQEIAWPFARDAWPPGKAFRCTTLACGGALEVYIRPKLGFCNCATGVAGDSEVDNVADLDLLSDRFAPLRDGEAVVIGGMAGRRRSYAVTMADGSLRRAVGLAISQRCDVVVAASQGTAPDTTGAQQAVAGLIERPAMRAWLRELLGKG